MSRVRVAIVGAGFGGLGAAIQLKRAGIDDFVVLERAGDVGGTWHANTYPGAQCDIPSLLYSFSFAPNPEWTRLYPSQPEIKRYLRHCTETFGITPHLRLGHEMLDATWEEGRQHWRVTTDRGTWEARVLVAAFGPFSAPSVPDFPGLDTFEGAVFHSAGWDHEHDLAGERVAVIGTGASAVQIIPRLQPLAESLTVFQRTPAWILPHPDRALGGLARGMLQSVPGAHRLARTAIDLAHEALVPGLVAEPALLKGAELLARAHLHRQVRDARLRAKLTPDYAFGCKRPTFSNDYYPALGQPNVEVVTASIDEIRPHGIVTVDGRLHELDTIVLSTGFRMTDHPMFPRVRGRAGTTLAEAWSGGPQAYLGTTVSGFPNLFFLLGPNSVVYTSQVVTIEAQVAYLLSALRTMGAHGLASVDVRREVQSAFAGEVDRRLSTSVWNTGGCRSYYLDDAGRNFTFYPGFARRFRARTRSLDLGGYTCTPARPAGELSETARTA